MKKNHFFGTVLAAGLLLSLGACSDMNRRQQNTAIGAGVGAAAGAVLTGGSLVGAGVGAAVGGVIGKETTK
jgi:osmotically inducible lipoprotein OsmB